jgi:hypothetical protein
MSSQQLHKTVAAMSILGVVLVAADNAFVGTWKLNPEKSTFAPGSPSMKSATVRVEVEGTGLKATVEGLDGQGNPLKYVVQGPLDGSPGPITGSPWADTVETKQVNDHTITAVAKKDRKVAYKDRRVISKDGKSMTIARTGVTPDGKKYSNTLFLERQ